MPDSRYGSVLPVEVGEGLALLNARPRTARDILQGAQEVRRFPDPLLARLRLFADQQASSLDDVLLSAFQTLLHRYTGSPDIVTGFPASPPVRTNFAADPSFRELLAQVRANVQRDSASAHAVFQSTFQCGGLTQAGAGLDLSSQVNYGDAYCVLSYSPDLFEAATIHRMLDHYDTILEGIAENPDERVSRLPVLTNAERHKILVEWNDTHADYPRSCVHKLFEEQVRRTPDAIALVYEDRELTYAQLNASANRLAHALSGLGVGPNVMVGICLERSVEMVVGLLAILKAGGAYAPLDPVYPKQRLAFMLADLQAPVLLCRSRAVIEGLTPYAGTVLPVDEWLEITAHQSSENPESPVEPANLAYVLYTSGSTGQPKGVLIPHRALVNYLVWCTAAYAADQGRGSPVHTPIGFDLTITSLFPPLLAGRCAVLVREDPTLETLTAAIQAGDFSLVKLTPAHLEALSHKLNLQERRILTRTFVVGGEALLGETLGVWRKQSPEVRLINEYGPTEATVGCCVYEVPPGPIASSAVPIGRPIANTRLYVLDRNLEPVPIGVPGELHIAGDGLALGYHRRPELTAERFILDPFNPEPGARMYKTGDLVRYRADGNLEFLGRLDHQVKIRGFRIELNEIEAALVGHPGVRETVVIASEGVPGDRRLMAYIVPVPGTVLTEQELRGFLKQKLPDYMLPARYVFLSSLPLTSNGKVDRAALPHPGLRNELRSEPLDDPRDALECQLVKIWEEVLRTKPIGIHEDFFELGGNSLLAIRMLARASKELNRSISLGTLMLAPTIDGLAATVRDPKAFARPQVLGIQPYGSRPPFFCVGAGPLFRDLAHGLGSDQPFLGLPLPGLDSLPMPYRMEDIAAHCVQTVQEVQPHGPYFVGGWSDAGVMAYEIAQQLRQQGETVALVVLFDAENQSHRPEFSPLWESARMRFYFSNQWLRLQFRTLSSMPPRALAEHVRQRLAFRLAWLRGKIWKTAYRVHLRSGWRFNHGLHTIEYVSALVARDYQPRQYDGRVLLLRREQRPTGRYRDPQYGWGHVTNGLEILDVPGSHIDMFREPNVHVMADRLGECLLEAQEACQTTTIIRRGLLSGVR